ncbi:MAG: transporter associated domain-containing protein [Granulosicoccus sp.]
MTDVTPDSGRRRSLFDRLLHAIGIGGEPRDRNELLELLRDAQARKIVDADTLQMVEGVFQVVEMRVRDIMIPRGQMVVIDHDASIEELMPIIIESGHSRFPVINEDKDHVIGVLLAKDLLRYSGAGIHRSFSIDDILRKATFTPDTKRLNVLLKEFRAARNHMAIVLDEYGGVDGLVTIEDVLEEIVGEIDDEHDTNDGVAIRGHGDGRFSVRALTPIDEFNESLGTNFSDEDFDTIGGLLMQHIGHMPKTGERATINGCEFRVLSADSRRLHLLQVTPPV